MLTGDIFMRDQWVMDEQLQEHLCRIVGASRIVEAETIQPLWSGCGQVARVRWIGGDREKAAEAQEDIAGTIDMPGAGAKKIPRAVIKHVKMPRRIDHPRGWNTDRSTQRKVRSYEVEARWYTGFSGRCPPSCRVPGCLGHACLLYTSPSPRDS